MIYGYTIADTANRKSFQNTVVFMQERLCYRPEGEAIEDIDGGLLQNMTRGEDRATVESDKQVDYVAIKSNVPLPISCLVKWTE